MIIGSIIGIVLFILIYLATIPYQKKLRRQLDRKKHKLFFFYGMSMFLVDRIPKRFMGKESVVNSEIRKLSVRENIEKEKYLYLVEKMSVSLLVIAASLLVSLGIGISGKGEETGDITALKRAQQDVTTYTFSAENAEGQGETIVVNVPGRQLTQEQIAEALNKAESELLKKLLKDNKSADHVDRSLDLVNRIGDNIDVMWTISDSSIIDYEGNIGDDIPEEGELVELTATMTLEEVSEDYTFSLNVFPALENQSIQKQVQKYVNENDPYEEQVSLPASINGKQMRYFENASATTTWIVPIGILLAVVIFFLKDRDLKSEVKNRDDQMMMDYPEIVSQILLYYGAGLSLKSGIERIVRNYAEEKKKDRKLFRYAYEEMEMTLTKMNSGISEIEAIQDYGSRCGLHCYIKLAGILEQNLKRGAREVTYALKTEVNSAMMERKHLALKRGGEISTKLLGPMVIMLIISMAIIMVPALLSMNL